MVHGFRPSAGGPNWGTSNPNWGAALLMPRFVQGRGPPQQRVGCLVYQAGDPPIENTFICGLNNLHMAFTYYKNWSKTSKPRWACPFGFPFNSAKQPPPKKRNKLYTIWCLNNLPLAFIYRNWSRGGFHKSGPTQVDMEAFVSKGRNRMLLGKSTEGPFQESRTHLGVSPNWAILEASFETICVGFKLYLESP